MNMDASKTDGLQILSDRLQQLSDISSRFDALTKETDEKLNNVTKTANVLQLKMTPINDQMEVMRNKKRAFEECRQFLRQTSSYHTTTEKYIRELHQTSINNVDDYVSMLFNVKESLEFFSTSLPQQKNAENLAIIISDGSKSLANQFREIITKISDNTSAKFTPDKLQALANCDANKVTEHKAEFDEKSVKDLQCIANWFDQQGQSSVYLRVYSEVRAAAFRSAMKNLRASLVGVTNSVTGASPLVMRKQGLKDTPSKSRTAPRRVSMDVNKSAAGRSNSILQLDRRKSRNAGQIGLQPALGFDGVEQPEVDHEDLIIMISAFIRLCQLEFIALEKFSFQISQPQSAMADQLIARAKEFLIKDLRNFMARVRREFKQDPESLQRLVHVLDHLRQMQPEQQAALAPCSANARAEIEELVKEMRMLVSSSLEDYRDVVLTDTGIGQPQTLPADGTVHELTLQAMKLLQQLHQYEQTVCEVLTRDRTDGARGRDLVMGAYLSSAVANLLQNLEKRSAQYNDVVLHWVFLMNNFRYVQLRLEREKMMDKVLRFNPRALQFFSESQNKFRDGYLNDGWKRVLEILMEKNKPISQYRVASEHSGKLSEKEKALIKEKFKSFNEEFLAVHKAQSNYSVPNGDLKQELIQENKDYLLSKYSMFRDKYVNAPFSSKKDKYIKYTTDDLERMLEDFFRGE